MERKTEFHRSLFESSIDGIVIINARGIIQDVNPAALELTGYSAEEMIGQNVNILMGVPHHANHDSYIQRFLQTGEARIVGIGRDVVAQKKNGDALPIRLAVNQFELKGEIYFTGVIHDMTEEYKAKAKLKEYADDLERKVHERTKLLEEEVHLREKAQSELMQSQKLYEAIANNFPNGTIGVLDSDFNIILMQGTELVDMGFDSNRLKGENYISLLPDEVQDEVEMNLREVLKGERRVFEIFTGDKVYIGRSVPLANDQGKIDKILQVDIDITKQKKAEEEMIKALDKEKQLNKMKSNFVSMASHEFRTPLSSIKSSAALISRYQKTEDNEKRAKHIQKINSNVNNLNLILNDFLSLEKIETGLVINRPIMLKINDFIDEILEETSPLMKQGQHIMKVFEHTTEKVFLDPFLLRNILNNLLSNAFKYSDNEATIEFHTTEVDQVFSIAVKDHGIGIAQEDQEQLFTRFYRASNATNIQGTGLGLNIVKRYADLMNAKLEFSSELNEGSTFVIRFTDYE